MERETEPSTDTINIKFEATKLPDKTIDAIPEIAQTVADRSVKLSRHGRRPSRVSLGKHVHAGSTKFEMGCVPRVVAQQLKLHALLNQCDGKKFSLFGVEFNHITIEEKRYEADQTQVSQVFAMLVDEMQNDAPPAPKRVIFSVAMTWAIQPVGALPFAQSLVQAWREFIVGFLRNLRTLDWPTPLNDAYVWCCFVRQLFMTLPI
jgi:hypothetical protein